MSINGHGMASWVSSFFDRKARFSQKRSQRTSPPQRSGPVLEVVRLEERTLLNGGNAALIYAGPAGGIGPEVNVAFLQEVYNDLLHRALDPSGQTAWGALLNAGVTRTTVVYDIETNASEEYQTDEVNQAYGLLLHRPADPSGLQTGLHTVSTLGLQAEYAFIAGSPEYRLNRGGGTINGWLNAVYQDALNRAADPGGQSAFGQALAGGAKSFQQVAALIFTSPEYYQDLVAGYYTAFNATSHVGELDQAAWVSRLQSGQSPEQMVAGILGAPELYA
jgi:hypothetical protein